MWGVKMVCHGKGQAFILGPAVKVPQDENKTKRTHTVIAYSHVVLVKEYFCWHLWLAFVRIVVSTWSTCSRMWWSSGLNWYLHYRLFTITNSLASWQALATMLLKHCTVGISLLYMPQWLLCSASGILLPKACLGQSLNLVHGDCQTVWLGNQTGGTMHQPGPPQIELYPGICWYQLSTVMYCRGEFVRVSVPV